MAEPTPYRPVDPTLDTSERRSAIRARIDAEGVDPAAWIDFLQGNLESVLVVIEIDKELLADVSRERSEFRLLWQCAAGVLRRNHDRIRQPGPHADDERRMLAHAEETRGPVGAAGTQDWLRWLPSADLERTASDA